MIEVIDQLHELTTTTATVTPANAYSLPLNHTAFVYMRVIARDAAGNVAGWTFNAFVKNVNNVLSVVGAPSKVAFKDAAAAAWDALARISPDGTEVEFAAQGAAGVSISWSFFGSFTVKLA